jgi:hypothetical protein
VRGLSASAHGSKRDGSVGGCGSCERAAACSSSRSTACCDKRDSGVGERGGHRRARRRYGPVTRRAAFVASVCGVLLWPATAAGAGAGAIGERDDGMLQRAPGGRAAARSIERNDGMDAARQPGERAGERREPWKLPVSPQRVFHRFQLPRCEGGRRFSAKKRFLYVWFSFLIY